MGYRSDITIVCGKSVFEALCNVCKEHSFLPEVKRDGEFYVLLWWSVKWHSSFPEVQAVQDALSKFDEANCKDVECAYKLFTVGEDLGDIESQSNDAGDCALEDYYMQCSVVHWLNERGFSVEVGSEDMAQKIRIRYLDDTIERLRYVDGKSDWIDLRAAEDVTMSVGEFKLIPLGVAMQLPDGYEAHIVPRSSTYKNFGIIQTNHTGIIDNSYCGSNDWWYMPAYALRDTTIHKNDRICQFRIVQNQPRITFDEIAQLEGKDRGGIGSTGIA